MVPVQKISNKYFIYTKSDWLRREAATRAPGTRSARGDYGLTTSNYVCVEYGMAKGVPDEIVDNADDPLKPLVEATQWVTNQIMLEQEANVANIAFGTGWSTSATTGMFSGPATVVANTGVIGRGLFRFLKNHPDIVDRIKYGAGPGNPAIVTVQAIAALAGLNSIQVGLAINDTGLEGGTASISYLWGNHLLLEYVPSGPSLMTPAAGYLFTYQNRVVSRFREEQERQDVVEAIQSWVAVQTATDAAYFIKSAA